MCGSQNMIRLLLILAAWMQFPFEKYLSSNNNCIIDEQKADESAPSFCNTFDKRNENGMARIIRLHLCCIMLHGLKKDCVMHFSHGMVCKSFYNKRWAKGAGVSEREKK